MRWGKSLKYALKCATPSGLPNNLYSLDYLWKKIGKRFVVNTALWICNIKQAVLKATLFSLHILPEQT